MGKKYIGFAGTYTRQSSEGIYGFVLDTEAGSLNEVQVAAKVGSPTYLTMSEDNRYLYSVAQDGNLGGVAAFDIDKETGALEPINRELKEGAPPCHLDIFQNELVTANYHEGTVELSRVNGQGAVEPVSSKIQDDGNGPHKRQEKPHMHYAGYTPDGNYVITADLGTDELKTYQVENGKLIHAHTFHTEPGSGPRHIEFHPSGNTAYLITELSSEVIVLDYNADQGSFVQKQSIRAIPADFHETNDASAIHISSDGRFLYTGNRGHNSITVFQVDEQSKELTFVEYTPTGGAWPRDFVLDPSEAFIIASNQHTGNLVLFSRDAETGRLTQLNSTVDVPEAVCVKFLADE
ncbi:lactonase family protein [Virgibacillus sp. NKC19-3]|uniref:lactonase family protein n=1 Tax=Virgibacillus saliphilus TaxID=2831674 RepID=UPI001C9B5780|nr:lactonase family protein [Virgibacillus sp. NKC19-3]MBY7145071.1 lactonase family protein [Virgibacillus sp. NKC19-3]